MTQIEAKNNTIAGGARILKSLQCLVPIALLLCSFQSGFSQQSIDLEKAVQAQQSKWHLGMGAGIVLAGPGNDLVNEMEVAGYGFDTPDYVETFWGIPIHHSGQNYPQVKMKSAWRFYLGYNLNNRRGLTFSYGRSLGVEAVGFPEVWNPSSFGTSEISIAHEVHTFQADYNLRFKSSIGGFGIGPVLAIHEVIEEFNTTSTEHSLKAGFHIGYKVPLLDKKNGFMALGADYTLLPKVEIGEQALALGIDTSNSDDPQTDQKISLSTLSIEFSAGIKF